MGPVGELRLVPDLETFRILPYAPRSAAASALDAQGIALEQYYAELGHGQQEISTAHAPALRAADEQLIVRETIRGVAARHGLVASLAPKPWPETAGNGCHIHVSLWDNSGEHNRTPTWRSGE